MDNVLHVFSTPQTSYTTSYNKKQWILNILHVWHPCTGKICTCRKRFPSFSLSLFISKYTYV